MKIGTASIVVVAAAVLLTMSTICAAKEGRKRGKLSNRGGMEDMSMASGIHGKKQI